MPLQQLSSMIMTVFLLDRGLPQLTGEKVLTTIRHKQKRSRDFYYRT